MFEFEILAEDAHSKARTGKFHTPHGAFETPCFVPCGTKGTVKTLTPDELKSLGCEIVLANTFHLMLRPGGETVQHMGGLHDWTGWNGPMLTDSGGFQVFSLERIRKIEDNGVIFQSPIDGSTHVLTPEKSIEIQEQLGADIIMAFDDCPPGNADYAYAKKSLARTHEWAKRSLKAKKRKDQALFPIVQGATHEDLRKDSAKFMADLNTSGIAIGGVAVGEPKPYMMRAVDIVEPFLPKSKPRYLMGIGEPVDLIEAVRGGMDIFDCVLPTRLARHGSFLTKNGRHDIGNKKFVLAKKPLDQKCHCYACQKFSAGYIQHLMREREMLGARLLTIHNLHFLLELMRQIRAAIKHGKSIRELLL